MKARAARSVCPIRGHDDELKRVWLPRKPFETRLGDAPRQDNANARAVGEVNRPITKVISRPHHWASRHMDMRIRQTRNEVSSGAIYDNRIGRHLDPRPASNLRNAISAHQDNPTLFNPLVR